MTKKELKLYINKVVSYNQFYNKEIETYRPNFIEDFRKRFNHNWYINLLDFINKNRAEKEKLKFFNYTNAVWYYLDSSYTEVYYEILIDILKVNYVSPSGSAYVYTEDGVYRLSDHWGKVASCNWFLSDKNDDRYTLAYCPWEDFRFQDSNYRQPYYIIREASEEVKKSLEGEGLIEYDERGFMICNTTYDVIADRLGYTDELVLS